MLKANLGPQLQVKEEEQNEEEEQVHEDEFADEVGQNFLQLPQYRRVASVRDLCFSHDRIKSCFSHEKPFDELIETTGTKMKKDTCRLMYMDYTPASN